jgi:hypothetical protein
MTMKITVAIPIMSNFISSYLHMNIFGAIIIVLNITHVHNISFCSSMFIKSNIKIYNWADIIKTNYKTCLSHPALPIMVQWRKEMFIWQKIQYSAPKNGHLKFCICIKPVIHFFVIPPQKVDFSIWMTDSVCKLMFFFSLSLFLKK